jgi:hypothetical protein
MDPWLEDPTIWPSVHGRLITSIADELVPQLASRYYVGVESRLTLLSGLDVELVYKLDVSIYTTASRADVRSSSVAVIDRPEVRRYSVSIATGEETEETYLAIQEIPTRKLVTVIEILSPTNKKTKDARAAYLKKRDDPVFASINFVEIDLLRAGEPIPVQKSPPPSDYRIPVCRARRSKDAVLYAFQYTTPIPTILIPLLPGDREPMLDLNTLTHAVIDRGRYDLVVDYAQPPDPPLRSEDEAWAKSIVAQALAKRSEETRSEGNGP